MTTTPDEISFAPPPRGGQLDPVCPQCGFGLRHLTVPRCPECGLTFDPADADNLYRVGWFYRRARRYIRALRAWPVWFVVICATIETFTYMPFEWVDGPHPFIEEYPVNYVMWISLHVLALLYLRHLLRRWASARLLGLRPRQLPGGWRNERRVGLAVVIGLAFLWGGGARWPQFGARLPWLEVARAHAATGWGAQQVSVGIGRADSVFPTPGGVRVIMYRGYLGSRVWGYEYVTNPADMHGGWSYTRLAGNWYFFR